MPTRPSPPPPSFVRPSAVRRSVVRPAALLAASLLLLAGCGSDSGDQATDAEASTAEQTPASASTSAEPEAEDSSEATGPEVTVPVYWVVSTEQAGPRLVREFTTVRTEDPLLATAELVTSGEAADPDYRTLWPAAEITSVTADDSAITVELADDSWATRPDGMGPRAARQALQQMVFSLQGVAQDRLPVTFTVDGQPATVFGIDTSGGVRNQSPLQVLNLVSITEPETGAVIRGDELEVTGIANSFEANVVCQVRRDGDVLISVPMTAEGWMGEKLFPFTGTIPLADVDPGPATLLCSTDDPTGGVEGVGIFSDDKDLVLR